METPKSRRSTIYRSDFASYTTLLIFNPLVSHLPLQRKKSSLQLLGQNLRLHLLGSHLPQRLPQRPNLPQVIHHLVIPRQQTPMCPTIGPSSIEQRIQLLLKLRARIPTLSHSRPPTSQSRSEERR